MCWPSTPILFSRVPWRRGYYFQSALSQDSKTKWVFHLQVIVFENDGLSSRKTRDSLGFVCCTRAAGNV